MTQLDFPYLQRHQHVLEWSIRWRHWINTLTTIQCMALISYTHALGRNTTVPTLKLGTVQRNWLVSHRAITSAKPTAILVLFKTFAFTKAQLSTPPTSHHHRQSWADQAVKII